MVSCSAGCPTGDHKSWGDCIRAKSLKAQWLGGTGPSFSEHKRFNANTAAYRDVVRAGGTIATAQRHGVEAALKEAEVRNADPR